ncbi:acyl-[ACP]--phospholipid O-acyltransferase [Amphritea japonica]|uniref:Acyl-[acyl-carrier-protein]-phospholipid O-acyltransferase/long-chain-fatty-acid--[acyl-carrier-protein] ligase n=1 Tax=Amphritea japonica ATCC BAA-1530 TaxID=1278309 RepID=A0A7R6PJY9_9GAMM|nr:acyl-[ACP]--phospholipid O-acyltransferase [Amphritea japonica]BBB25745.1 acyl-[acyl-carrier-protein]-phospholipid O-acyltransferase/long-chain-fatty-acid--[acyl-carrier-protein] ligase [Amphritea japonica ATCC BAA-1530]
MSALLRISGFLAFISIAFINAFVDLGHKIIIQNTLFKAYDGDLQILLTAVVNGLILLPFIMLFTPAGFLADKYPKNQVMKLSAWAAVAATGLITLCYFQGWFIAAFALTFVLALQSAFYSPAKYGFIRELVGESNITEGNGWVQAVTMVAILSGIAVFSLLFEMRVEGVFQLSPEQSLQKIAPLGWLLIAGSLIELVLAYRLPKTRETDRAAVYDWKAYRSGRTLVWNLSSIYQNRTIWLSIVGVSLFWSVSQVMLAVFPAVAEAHHGVHNTFVIQGTMALAGVGIMVGSVLAGRWSSHYINIGLIPLGAVGVAVGLILLPQVSSVFYQGGVFFLIGLSGALLNVPLQAMIQFNAGSNQTGKVLAGSNFIQNVAMLSFLVVTVVAAWIGIDGLWLLWMLAGLGVIGAVFAIRTLPQALVRVLVAALMKRKYNLQVLGFENLPRSGQGVLLLGNHISWLDWAMIQMACPRHIHFVMERSIYERWYLKWFMSMYRVIPISSGKSRQALQQVGELISAGHVVCLFPEGAISHTGQIGEFKKGFERACEEADGVIVPFYLRGLWGSRFSRSTDKMKTIRSGGLKRDVIVAYGQQMPINSCANDVKKKVAELSIHTWERYTSSLQTLPQSFIHTAKSAMSDMAIADVQGEPLSYRRLLTAVVLFSRRLKQTPGQRLGLLLPTSTAGAIANLAGLVAGRTLVNLNFTASESSQLAALEQAEVETILTAHKFVSKLKARGIDPEPLFEGRQVIYMEDVKAAVSKAEGLSVMLLVSLLPGFVLQWWLGSGSKLEDTAAILFSSGSEGAPKGVMLSHRNIQANLRQIADVLNVRDDDCVMATLPLFHAFGLTVTCFMPLIEGIPVVCHPDPTDALNIGKGVAKYRATMICATSTFLRLYARNKKLHPLMFESLRIAVAGAERLDPVIQSAFESRFRVPVVEGYGSTETTPVASVNLPDYLSVDGWFLQEGTRKGTVGLSLPGSTFRIVDPDSLEELPTGEDGLILIGGTQIMQGYLNNAEKTAEVIVRIDGLRWYKSGDKGHLDEDGFLTIVDRYSRFAKLGGEMVSLGAVEQEIQKHLQSEEAALVAINLPDAKKGEKVVLLVDADIDPESFRRYLTAQGVAPLMLPAEVFRVDSIPLLGSGKTNYPEARLVAERLAGKA